MKHPIARFSFAGLLAVASPTFAADLNFSSVEGFGGLPLNVVETGKADGPAILIGCGTGLLLGVFGALPPALKALRSSVAVSLKAV